MRLEDGSWTNPIWEAVRRHTAGRFAGPLAWGEERLDLSSGGETDPIDALMVSGSFFETLGVRPAVGRLLTGADDRRGGGPDGPTAVISERFWERRFGRDPNIVGRGLSINGIGFTIVGVVPARFLGPTVGKTFDVAAPIGTIDLVRPGGMQSQLDGRWTWWLNIMLRRQPGQSIEAATATLRGVQPQIRAESLPEDGPPAALKDFLTGPLALAPASTGLSELRRHYREPLIALAGIVALVLLIACANVANLLLARAASRRHELAARLALGASHGRLVRQLLTESLLLAVPGAIAGLAVAVWGSRFLVAQIGRTNDPVALALPLDWRLLGFLAAVSIVTAIGFGLVPAWRARRLDAADAVSHASHGRFTRRGAVSGPLVVVQIALSLAARGGRRPLRPHLLGPRDPRHRPRSRRPARRVHRHRQGPAGSARPRLRRAAAGGAGRPRRAHGSDLDDRTAQRHGLEHARGDPRRGAAHRPRGDDVHERGHAGLVRDLRHPPHRRPRRRAPAIAPDRRWRWRTRRSPGDSSAPRRRSAGACGSRPVRAAWRSSRIVGLVADAAYRGVREEFQPTLFRPLSPDVNPPPFTNVTVRTTPGGAQGLQPALTRAIRGVDPTLSVSYQSMTNRMRDQLTEVRTIALLSGFFGVLALLLAAIGLYGVTSYGVNERRREIGIRMTLGAGRAAAERFVLGGVARLVGIGVALGLAASLALSPIVRTMLYELQPRDPATIALAAVVLTIVGLLAGWLPARRAARIDPAQVLREG